MASRPDELPESIVIQQFAGIKNTVSEERLNPGELSRAINIDIDDAGQPRRRRGHTRVADGSYHSLKKIGRRTLVVKDGELGLLNPAYAFHPIAPASVSEIGYCEVGDTIFYSSADVSGKILSDDSRVDWGQREDGTARWLSPVVRPTETLGAIRGKLLGAPPQASLLTAFNGRIYMAHDNVLWATELYQFDYVDKTRNYLQFEKNITVIWAVNDGIYVGTEDGLYYLSGNFGQGMSRKEIMSAQVVRGSAVQVPGDDTKAVLDRGGQAGEAVMMMTDQGIVTCLDGGTVINATKGRVVFPMADSAAALHRDDSGVSSYLAVTRSSGGPATNARIGDHCDAEIRRATGS